MEIVLVGKAGCGKSSSGNTIFDKKVFPISSWFTGTKTSMRESRTVGRRKIHLVDTPGLDTAHLFDELNLITQGKIYVFLLVIQLGKFTDEQKKAVEKMENMFGERVREFTMILFTHGDKLKTPIHRFITDSAALQQVVKNYGYRYHVFNNNSQSQTQVTQLFGEIDQMWTVIQKRKYCFENPCGKNDLIKDAINKEVKVGAKRGAIVGVVIGGLAASEILAGGAIITPGAAAGMVAAPVVLGLGVGVVVGAAAGVIKGTATGVSTAVSRWWNG
uniref:AIG1-type G domain-containing protein n=1 Tax=Esox lucius TaxID=8010 RepID=A0AAY5KMB4_ESOLU